MPDLLRVPVLGGSPDAGCEIGVPLKVTDPWRAPRRGLWGHENTEQGRDSAKTSQLKSTVSLIPGEAAQPPTAQAAPSTSYLAPHIRRAEVEKPQIS